MTVAEMIERLEELPQDTIVLRQDGGRLHTMDGYYPQGALTMVKKSTLFKCDTYREADNGDITALII